MDPNSDAAFRQPRTAHSPPQPEVIPINGHHFRLLQFTRLTPSFLPVIDIVPAKVCSEPHLLVLSGVHIHRGTRAPGKRRGNCVLVSSFGRDVIRSRRRTKLRKWLIGTLMMCPLLAREPLADRIVHNDPSRYRLSKAVHDGAGQMHYFAMFDEHSLDTNLFF